MSLQVRTTPEPDAQVRAIDEWRRRNRRAAPDPFLDELAAAFDVIGYSPSGLEALPARGGRYEDTVARVLVERRRNRFRFNDGRPVYENPLTIEFAGGLKWTPGTGALRALVAALGHERDGWTGARLVVYARETASRETGKVRYERAVTVLTEGHAAEARSTYAGEYAGYDDSPEALAARRPIGTQGRPSRSTLVSG